MTFRHLLVFCLLPLVMMFACGDDSSEARDDMGYVTLDGGGPLFPGDGSSLPPPADSGGTSSGEKGKFCNGAFINGKKISLSIKIGSVTLAATSGSCSKCQGLALGSNPMTIYSGGAKVGGGTVTIASGKEYVFWMTYDQATKKGNIQGKTLDPGKGEGCEKYMPKL